MIMRRWGVFGGGFALFCALGSAQAAPVSVTILHTNDLHSHFRPERTPLGLGGVARLATAIKRVRAGNPAGHTLLVDGGDFSEGNIYYNLEAGTETMRMMDRLGYDVVLVGNHDWLNGPDQLLQSYARAQPRFPMLGANFDLSQYPRREEFRKAVPPYFIKEVNGAKIAFIGLVTYEFIYDGWLKPVKVASPFDVLKNLAAKLKREVDVVVAISHNTLKVSEQILRESPDVDLMIGAHDHVKLTRPIKIRREGRPDAWLVETGSWGRFLGRVEIKVTPRSGADAPRVELEDYKLQQMDSSIPDDPEVAGIVDRLDGMLQSKYGPIFDDHVGDSHIEVTRNGQENYMGNLATDSYLAATQADFALDQVNMIYGELHRGKISSADVYNSNPAIHDPRTEKSWTLKTINLKGKTLKWVLNVLYSTKFLAQAGIMSASNLRVTFNPMLTSKVPMESILFGGSFGAPERTVISEILVGGKPLDPTREYKVAAGGGIIHAMEILNSFLPGTVPMGSLRDTGMEDWRVMADYIRGKQALTRENLVIGDRVRSEQPDVGLTINDVMAAPMGHGLDGSLKVRVRAEPRNFGAALSPQATLEVLENRNGSNLTVDPEYVRLGDVRQVALPGYLRAGKVEWEVNVSRSAGLIPVTVRVKPVDGEVNLSNNEVTIYLPAGSVH